MRNAPSVLYPVGRCAFYGRLLAVLGVLGLAAWSLGRWSARGAEGDALYAGVAWVGAVLWLLWLGFAAWSWQRSPVGWLQWDALAPSEKPAASSGGWRWRNEANQDGALLSKVELMLDLQSRVLLRLRSVDAASSWVWLERSRDPARWDDLRRALVANA